MPGKKAARRRAIYAAKKAAGLLPKRLTQKERAAKALTAAEWMNAERPHWKKTDKPKTWKLKKPSPP